MMEQKRAMLYPPLKHGTQANTTPVEAPPSYDMAMASDPVPSSSSVKVTTAWTLPSAAQPPATHESAADTLAQPQESAGAVVQQPRLQSHSTPLPTTTNTLTVSARTRTPTTITTRVIAATRPPALGPNPCAVTCPVCGTCRTTRMTHTANSRTHMSAVLLCLVGCCCCACCVPYLMNSCRTGNHYCAKCNTFLGAYSPRNSRSTH